MESTRISRRLRIVNQTVKDSVGQREATDLLMPARDWQWHIAQWSMTRTSIRAGASLS